jgi:prepilin-type N-terminal cleavage/methylation domain-containing protein
MNRPASEPHTDGFTLIELLVVIAIVSILVTSSTIMVLQFVESRGLRENGRIFEMVFDRARQLAQSEGDDHFVIIEDETENTGPKLIIVKDMNRDGQPIDFSREPNPQAGEDLLVDQYELSTHVRVHVGEEEGAGPLVSGSDGNGRYWIRFSPNGTMNGAGIAPDSPRVAYRLNRTWRESSQPPSVENEQYDFLMTRVSGEKLFFDWEPAVGKIVTTYYKN